MYVGSHQAERAEAHRGRRGAALTVALGACLLLVSTAAAFAYAPMRVVVDGVVRSVALGTTASELVADGLAKAPAGDLLSVSGGVARPRGGLPPRLTVYGGSAAPMAPLSDGAVVISRRGADVTESVITTIVATPIPVIEEGSGPSVTVKRLGSPGMLMARVGVVSRSIVASWPLEPSIPMVLQRSPIPGGAKMVALTFDDGPWPGQTEAVLDILSRERIKATFFMLGLRVQRSPSLARRVVAEGHTVGNHTQTHVTLGKAPAATVVYQMNTGAATIKRYTGVQTTWFRAPGGSLSPLVKTQARALGERIAGWAVDPTDWTKRPSRFIVQRVVAATRPGAIILMHDGGGDRAQTINALPEIIRQLRAQGYTFVTLDDMYGAR